MSAESKCSCQHCNGHISFPSEMAGQIVNCPHCQLETPLFIPPVVAPSPKVETPSTESGNKAFPIGAAVLIAVVVALAFLDLTGIMGKSSKPKLENLKPVEGAFGWKLGEKLPEQLKEKGIYGGYYFRPDKPVSPFDHYELFVTDDGRIYCIEATGYAPDVGEDSETCKNALISVLTEKYGRQPERQDAFGVGANYFFGTKDQTAHLNIYNQNLFTLKYSDRNLSWTNYTEREAEQKQAEEEKKAALSKRL